MQSLIIIGQISQTSCHLVSCLAQLSLESIKPVLQQVRSTSNSAKSADRFFRQVQEKAVRCFNLKPN